MKGWLWLRLLLLLLLLWLLWHHQPADKGHPPPERPSGPKWGRQPLLHHHPVGTAKGFTGSINADQNSPLRPGLRSSLSTWYARANMDQFSTRLQLQPGWGELQLRRLLRRQWPRTGWSSNPSELWHNWNTEWHSLIFCQELGLFQPYVNSIRLSIHACCIK